TNGKALPAGNSLLGGLLYFGLDAMDAAEKKEMRDLAQRVGPYTPEEQHALLEYCASDTRALEALFRVMAPHIDLPRALLRGKYMQTAARMETAGIPLNMPMLRRIQAAWPALRLHLIREIDTQYGVYEGSTFKMQAWDAWCQRQHIA